MKNRVSALVDAQPARVLIIDDEPSVRLYVERVLSTAGYRTTVASDCADAIALAAQSKFDLLLTDVVMPGMHGHELAAQLQGQRPGLKVLYMSGFSLARAQHEMLETRAGVEPGSPILPKPFSAEALTKKVSELLGRPSAPRSPFARPRPGPDSRSDPWGP